MPLIGEMKFLERQQFFNGQRLFADDLQNLEQFNRKMRWLHNQSLHQPGVGSGYAVAGAKGDRQVTIGAGYAIDALGREIVLTETRTEQIPPVADDGYGNPVAYDLTVAYPADSELEESETRDGVCLPRGAVRRREMPAFCWVRLGPEPDRLPVDDVLKDQLARDLRIRLARVEILNCQLYRPISIAERRSARPAQQPYVACGRTGSDGWVIHVTSNGIELTYDVDTRAAGFRTEPCYFAHVAGSRLFKPNATTLVLEGFSSVSDATADGFTFSFFIPAMLLQLAGDADDIKALSNAAAFQKQGWFVEWLGVER
jgi:hypothetical protein